MFAGHFAAAMLARRIEPKISFGTAALAALLADFLVFVFLIAGVEHFDPVPHATLNRFIGRDIAYSHSLLMGALWAALFAGAYFLWRRYSRGAWILFAAVLSHWFLDAVSHRPDMPLAPGISYVVGLGLWDSMPATLIVEGGFWLLAILLYVRATRSPNRWGVIVFWFGVVLITLTWHRNISAGIDPDPVKAGIGGLIFFSLLLAWAYWVNRLRRSDHVSTSRDGHGAV
jgi:hypothetical protein